MLGTRMEGRVDNWEPKMANLEQGITHIENEFVSIRELVLETINEMRITQRVEEREKALMDVQQSPTLVTTERTGENSNVTEQEPGRFRHLELPLFNGDDLTRWIFRLRDISASMG